MSNERESQKEIRRILRLLEATARLVETSVISSEHRFDAEERCARQFNNALTFLTDLDAVPEGLFEPLKTEDATFGDICFACHQVSAYIKEGCIDDFDLDHMKKTIGDELKDVSEVVRQSMPSFLKDMWAGQTQDGDVDAAETVEVTSDEDDDSESTTTVEQRIGRLEGQMETVVEILQEIRTQQQQDNDA